MATLEYATPSSTRRSDWLLVLALGAAAGWLGAKPFADAVGVPTINDSRDAGYVFLRIGCGIGVALIMMVVLAFVLREARAMGSSGRPLSQTIAITLLICGTVCVLGAMVIPLYATHSGASIEMRVEQLSGGIGVQTEPPLVVDVLALAVLTFLGGAALIGVGIRGGAVEPQIGRRVPLANAPAATGASGINQP